MNPLFDLAPYHELSHSFKKDLQENLPSYQSSITKETLEDYIRKRIGKHHSPSPNGKKLEDYKIDRYKHSYEKLINDAITMKLPLFVSLYQNCLLGNPGNSKEKILILGKNDNIKDPTLLRNFGKLNEVSVGSIFSISHWTLLNNDLMLLAAIHVNKTIMLSIDSYPMAPQNLWNQEEKKLSMLGREIVILHAAGYKKLDYPYEAILSYIFVPPCDRALTDQFTLGNALEACQEIKEHQITDFFKSEGPSS